MHVCKTNKVHYCVFVTYVYVLVSNLHLFALWTRPKAWRSYVCQSIIRNSYGQLFVNCHSVMSSILGSNLPIAKRRNLNINPAEQKIVWLFYVQ